MRKIIVEVGSTVTKVDLYDGKLLNKIKDVTILFKKHYGETGKLLESDVNKLIELVNELKSDDTDIYVAGTSIFRNLDDSEQRQFLADFKDRTGIDFNIISQDEESDLTVLGAVRNVRNRVCVFVGGGGSIELTIYDNGIVEKANSPIGVIDVMKEFPDLKDDIANTSIEDVKDFIKKRVNLPKEKADILILAGGAHERFARVAPIVFESNTLYKDSAAPIMMNMESRTKESERYFKEASLDEIRARVDDPAWWDATRAVCALILVVAEEIGAKYIVPTDIGMAYGIISE